MIPETFPTFKKDLVLLRPFISDDVERVFLGLSHPEVIKYYGVNYKSLSETQLQMEWFKSLEKEGTGIWWAILSLDEKEFYGAVGLNNLSTVHKKAEIGFWLLPNYWGKGIMQTAVPIVCDYGFEQRRLHRIEAFVETKNKSSINLLGRLNFKHEGTMNDCEIKNEEFISLDIYAKLY